MIEEKESVNQQLAAKVIDLTNLCKEANKKIDANASIIQEHESTISDQNKKLVECNDFISFVREREGKLTGRLGQLEDYYQAKRQQRCILFRRNHRQSHPAEEIVLGIGKLLVKEKIDAQSPVSDVRQLA